ncbi:MAG TPA: glycolate oxidase subunit GlcE [Burkholderiaceae bacterium]|nr:glycolate oxidase subunit GlcE [Burkholderiaceae bacterium]
MSDDPALRRLIDQVASARARRAPLAIRGHGSKDFYGETPRGEPLKMSPLTGISHYEPTELVVTARAGTSLAEVEAVLAEHGQCLAFEPPRFALNGATPDTSAVTASRGTAPRGGTVGGMVAAGLAGPARATVGAVRDFVLGAALLSADGEVMRFGGEVMKNVAGYDVARVLAGSLGILGPIVEVSLKVLPQPPARATLRFEWPEARALQQLQQWAAQPLPLRASAWWNGMLVVQLAGAEAAVRAAAQALGGERIDAATADAFWRDLRDQCDEFFVAAESAVRDGATLWRLSLAGAAPPLAAAGEQLIEWHGALRWIVSHADAATMRALALAHGGHATEFRGAKRDGVFTPLAPALARIHRELKARFDPDRLFNPGRLYPDLG